MWRSSELVVERSKKNDSTDRKMPRNECTPEYQLNLESSSKLFICVCVEFIGESKQERIDQRSIAAGPD